MGAKMVPTRGRMMVNLVRNECKSSEPLRCSEPVREPDNILLTKRKQTMEWLESNNFSSEDIDNESQMNSGDVDVALNADRIENTDIEREKSNSNEVNKAYILIKNNNYSMYVDHTTFTDTEGNESNFNEINNTNKISQENTGVKQIRHIKDTNITSNQYNFNELNNKISEKNNDQTNYKKTTNIESNEFNEINDSTKRRNTNRTVYDFDDTGSHISERSVYQYSSSSFVPSTEQSEESLSSSHSSFVIHKVQPIVFSNIFEEISEEGKSVANVRENRKDDKVTEPEISSLPQVQTYIKDALNKAIKRKTVCKFCKLNVTNFERHLQRHHESEKEVQELMALPKSTKQNKATRRQIIALLRYETQFEAFIESSEKDEDTLPCCHCKRLVKATYLRRHYKVCAVHPINNTSSRVQHRAQSQTLLACAADWGNADAAVRVKKEVFPKMKADAIGLVARKDHLIRYYGENYLKKHKRAQIIVACSNKLRECARLLVEARRRTNNTNLTFFEMLCVRNFDLIVTSTKTICGYHEDNKKFKAPSLAIHMGTTIKKMCDLCSLLILKGTLKCPNIEERLKDVKRLKHIVETQWNCEVASLAIKDLAENKWNSPVRLPLTKDVIKFKDYVIKISDENFKILQKDRLNKKAFKRLTESVLCLTILFNRRRIGDIQYVHLESYSKNFETIDQEEFSNVLTESEKALTASYKRIVAGGKGSRAITILFPKNLQEYINLLLQIRTEIDIVPKKNPYLFACPGVENQWIRADVIMRKLAEASGVENPMAISSNKLRKQIGTLMQIINLSKEEYAQFAKFMGHTEKTHKEFYEITQDAYQTAKVSKLLTLFDKGKGLQYKGKPLEEINLDEVESEGEEDEIDTTICTTQQLTHKPANLEMDNDHEEVDVRNVRDFNTQEQLSSTSRAVFYNSKSDAETEHAFENKTKKEKKGNRVRWTDTQKSIVKKHFQKHIKQKIPPKKDECLKFIEQNEKILHNLNWVRIKTFVYNTYKNND